MSAIQISLNEVAETAARLRSLNSRMYEELSIMKQQMNALDGTWISQAGEEIRSRFNLFSARFEKEKEVIEAYAAFLDLTVNTYDALESSITGNASSIQY